MSKNIFKLFCLFVLATVLHWGFVSLLGGFGLRVDVMLVFAIAVCAYVKPEYGYPAAFMSGLFLDFFGVKLFGHYAFLCTLSALAVYLFQTRLDLDSVVPQMIFVLILDTLATLGNGLLLWLFAGGMGWGNGWALVGGVVLSALLAPVIFWIVRLFFPPYTKVY